MKFTPVLLTLSLVANLALALTLARRASPPDATALARTSTVSKRSSSSDPSSNALRAALASGDASALEAAGLPADAVRQLLLRRAFQRFGERMRATQSPSPDGRWWRNRGPGSGNREEALLARRELSDAMMAAFGDDFGAGRREPAGHFGRYGRSPNNAAFRHPSAVQFRSRTHTAALSLTF